jgi:hypothetical protein
MPAQAAFSFPAVRGKDAKSRGKDAKSLDTLRDGPGFRPAPGQPSGSLPQGSGALGPAGTDLLPEPRAQRFNAGKPINPQAVQTSARALACLTLGSAVQAPGSPVPGRRE